MKMHKYIESVKHPLLNTNNNTNTEKGVFPGSINDSIEILQKQRISDVNRQYEDKKLQLQTEFVQPAPKQIDFKDTTIQSYNEDTNRLLQNEIESRKNNTHIQDAIFPVEYIWISTKSAEWNKNICVIELDVPQSYGAYTITNIFFQHDSQTVVSDYMKVEVENETKYSWFFRNRELLQYQGYSHIRNKQSKIMLHFEDNFDFTTLEIQIMVFN